MIYIENYSKICLYLTILCLLLYLNPVCATEVISGSGYTSGNGEGYWTEYSFINYCPLCGYSGTLETYVKGVNEITCTHCDADYSYSGRDKHEGYSRAWLIVYVEPEPTPTSENLTTNTTPITTTTLTPLEQALKTLQTNKII